MSLTFSLAKTAKGKKKKKKKGGATAVSSLFAGGNSDDAPPTSSTAAAGGSGTVANTGTVHTSQAGQPHPPPPHMTNPGVQDPAMQMSVAAAPVLPYGLTASRLKSGGTVDSTKLAKFVGGARKRSEQTLKREEEKRKRRRAEVEAEETIRRVAAAFGDAAPFPADEDLGGTTRGKGRGRGRGKKGQGKNLDSFMNELTQESVSRPGADRDRDRGRGGGYDGYGEDVVEAATTNVFIGNLSPECTEEDLLLRFREFGEIASVKIMWPRTAEQRARLDRHGFVAFTTRADAEDAKHRMNGAFMHGREWVLSSFFLSRVSLSLSLSLSLCLLLISPSPLLSLRSPPHIRTSVCPHVRPGSRPVGATPSIRGSSLRWESWRSLEGAGLTSTKRDPVRLLQPHPSQAQTLRSCFPASLPPRSTNLRGTMAPALSSGSSGPSGTNLLGTME